MWIIADELQQFKDTIADADKPNHKIKFKLYKVDKNDQDNRI